MKIRNQLMINKLLLVSALHLLFITGSVYCQARTVDEDSLTTVISANAFSEIPDEFTRLSNRLIEVAEFILPEEKVLNDDTIVTEYSAALEQRK